MYYFDNAASTKPTQDILQTYMTVSEQFFANPSSVHSFGEKASQLLNQARQQVAEILRFDTSEIYFTSSGTESNNWVLTGITQALKERHPDKNRILISSIEHGSMTAQIERLVHQGFKVDLIPVTDQGLVDMDKFANLLDNDVLLVSTMAVNNEIGAKQPLIEMSVELMKYPTTAWHVDAVQATTSELATIHNNRIDLVTLSSHKFHAVRGAGVLAKRKRIASHPMIMGGGQESGQRSSTENLAAIVTMSKALRLVSEKQADTHERLEKYKQQIIEALKDNNWNIHTPKESSAHIICASYEGIPGEVLVHAFAEKDIFISTTSACSSRRRSAHATLRAMGIPDSISESAIRMSMGILTTQEEVDYLIKQIPHITNKF
ncbi:cysteine desulfurase [Aerococcaceae bacterium DSM 111176]|nr:cysteine desulfurase [Aerococcaceae bacterium DSM 111176]